MLAIILLTVTVFSQDTYFMPGALTEYDFILYPEGSTFFAKNSYGLIEYSGTDIDLIVKDILNSGASNILAKSGIYTFDSYINASWANRNFLIEGECPASYQWGFDPRPVTKFVFPNGHGFYLNDVHAVILRNIEIRGKNPPIEGSWGILYEGGDTGGGGDADRILIENCFITQFNWGILLNHTWGSQMGGTIKNCEIRADYEDQTFYTAGLRIRGGASKWILEQTKIVGDYHFDAGIYLTPLGRSDDPISHLTMYSSQLTGVDDALIVLRNPDNVTTQYVQIGFSAFDSQFENQQGANGSVYIDYGYATTEKIFRFYGCDFYQWYIANIQCHSMAVFYIYAPKAWTGYGFWNNTNQGSVYTDWYQYFDITISSGTTSSTVQHLTETYARKPINVIITPLDPTGDATPYWDKDNTNRTHVTVCLSSTHTSDVTLRCKLEYGMSYTLGSEGGTRDG